MTFTLCSGKAPHCTLLLGLALVLISILLEGRRYRHLHHSKWRHDLLESGFFANLLSPARGSDPNPDCKRVLAADPRHTHFSIGWLTGIRLWLRPTRPREAGPPQPPPAWPHISPTSCCGRRSTAPSGVFSPRGALPADGSSEWLKARLQASLSVRSWVEMLHIYTYPV
jgi:hypothetical protein